MTRKQVVAVLLAFLAGLGLALWLNLPPGYDDSAACWVWTFDYLRFSDAIRRDTERTARELEEGRLREDDELRSEKVAFYEAKVELLPRLWRLVERHIELHGATYDCGDPYKGLFLMDGISVPSFRLMMHEEEIDRYREELKAAQSVTWWKIFTTIFPVLVPAVVTVYVARLGLARKTHSGENRTTMSNPGEEGEQGPVHSSPSSDTQEG